MIINKIHAGRSTEEKSRKVRNGMKVNSTRLDSLNKLAKDGEQRCDSVSFSFTTVHTLKY